MHPMLRNRERNAFIVKVGLLSAVAFILMYLDFVIPVFFPPFLKMDFSDVPALIGAFALGPVAGIFIAFIKNFFYFLTKTETMGVGPAANFITCVALVVPASLVYRYNRTRLGALTGVLIGTVTMTVIMGFANYFVFIPLYEIVLKYPLPAIISWTQTVNPYITDLKTLVIIGISPFNIMKGLAVSLVTFFIYKHISPILHK